MIHQDVTTSWVFEHYLIYLYISIADCDCIVSDKELDKIRLNAFKALNPERTSVLIKEVYHEYRSHTPEEKRNYIKENAAKYLRTESIKTKVIEDLQHLTDADEDSEEQIMFRYIRKAINNSRS
jgi:kynurenine formamidase